MPHHDQNGGFKPMVKPMAKLASPVSRFIRMNSDADMEVKPASWGYPDFYHPLGHGILPCKPSSGPAVRGYLQPYGNPQQWSFINEEMSVIAGEK